MNVAITGASGFVGRHVLAALSQYSVAVTAVARRESRDLFSSPRVSFVKMDLADPSTAFSRMGQPDILIHLAWGGLPNYSSLHHYEQELPLQYHFLKQMVSSGLGSLLVVGTCFEYGQQSGSLHEELIPRPHTPYGFAKDTLRQQLEYLQAWRHFNLTWSRLFYLYGEGQSERSLFPQLKQACQQGNQVFNMSGGEQLRDYLPAIEAARLIVALALKQENIGLINVCSGRPISVRKLVEDWIHDNGWSIELNLGYYPYPDHEPMAFWGDRGKLTDILGGDQWS